MQYANMSSAYYYLHKCTTKPTDYLILSYQTRINIVNTYMSYKPTRIMNIKNYNV